MKALRVVLLALSIAVLGASFTSFYASVAQAAYGRTLVGEFVNEGGSRFRIVGQGSGFVAPPGTPMNALDGKTVEVELTADGKVARITERPVPINPVTHGWSVVRGHLMVTDPATRTFTFAGDTQTYTAPPQFDVALYNGKDVEAKLDENGRVTEMRLVGPGTSQAYYPSYNPPSYNPPSYSAPAYNAPAYPPAVASGCAYGGQTYSAGAAVCQSGTQYRCDGTQWQSLGTACQVSAAGDAPRVLPPAAPRSCIIGDATVANGSSICRSGTTYRCDDGAWINVQTACQ